MSQYELDKQLSDVLVGWYWVNQRKLPWREDNDPFHVWLSEIMLQQTRVEAVKAYYIRFLNEIPTIEVLANTKEEKVLKLWEGLGYYSRARNLQKAAQIIMGEYGGIFPQEYRQILKLPGVGTYTAGAIASICFDAPTPAVDGNVLRVMARILAITESTDLPAVKRNITHALAHIYPQGQSGAFTQSLMELGATVCIPNGKPCCEACPVQSFCRAFQNNIAEDIPVKKQKQVRKIQELTVLVLVCDGCFAIRKRESKGLLAGMWEFPNVDGKCTSGQALELAMRWGVAPSGIDDPIERTHIFTHIKWKMTFYYIRCQTPAKQFHWTEQSALLKTYAVPVAFKLPSQWTQQ